MKTICTIEGRVVMSQDGDATRTMEVNAAQYPGAVVSVVSDEAYRVLMTPKWSPDPLLKIAKAGREIALNRLMGIAGREARAGNSALAATCDALVVALLDLTKAPAVLAATDDASLKAAVAAEYAVIVAATPSSIKNVFAGIQT